MTKLMNYGCGNAGGGGGGGGALIQMARARCSRHKRRVSPICYHTTLNPIPGTGGYSILLRYATFLARGTPVLDSKKLIQKSGFKFDICADHLSN